MKEERGSYFHCSCVEMRHMAMYITMSCVSPRLEAVFAHVLITIPVIHKIFIEHLLHLGTDLNIETITMNKVD